MNAFIAFSVKKSLNTQILSLLAEKVHYFVGLCYILFYCRSFTSNTDDTYIIDLFQSGVMELGSCYK